MKRRFEHPPEKLTGKRYWRSLGELSDTPEFRGWLEREFPAGAAQLELSVMGHASPLSARLDYQRGNAHRHWREKGAIDVRHGINKEKFLALCGHRASIAKPPVPLRSENVLHRMKKGRPR